MRWYLGGVKGKARPHNPKVTIGWKLSPAPAQGRGVPTPIGHPLMLVEAKIDINVLLTNTEKAARDAVVTELVNFIKSKGPQAFVRLGLAEVNEQQNHHQLPQHQNTRVRTSYPPKKQINLIYISTIRFRAIQLSPQTSSKYLYSAIGTLHSESVDLFVLARGHHQVLNELVEAFGDKLPAVSEAALSALNSLVKIMTPWTRHLILRVLLNRIATASKWQVETGALSVLDVLVVSAADQIANAMPKFVPVLATAIWDTKADVKKAARSSSTKSCPLVSNKDI
ncbi:translational elongation factor EF-1 alpha [Puccinia graminis f. sp. tritici]|uniref:Translational elongation factor EF-1 alpha n=1 Tax=Puccinia graminis f. sp. tritici TaxID=56615 RepID=A0A5B0RLL8_PUCGR|nr:translational elongation factor EF-1 alpha [Puccinia graminis f. sp. tritici]